MGNHLFKANNNETKIIPVDVKIVDFEQVYAGSALRLDTFQAVVLYLAYSPHTNAASHKPRRGIF